MLKLTLTYLLFFTVYVTCRSNYEPQDAADSRISGDIEDAGILIIPPSEISELSIKFFGPEMVPSARQSSNKIWARIGDLFRLSGGRSANGEENTREGNEISDSEESEGVSNNGGGYQNDDDSDGGKQDSDSSDSAGTSDDEGGNLNNSDGESVSNNGGGYQNDGNSDDGKQDSDSSDSAGTSDGDDDDDDDEGGSVNNTDESTTVNESEVESSTNESTTDNAESLQNGENADGGEAANSDSDETPSVESVETPDDGGNSNANGTSGVVDDSVNEEASTTPSDTQEVRRKRGFFDFFKVVSNDDYGDGGIESMEGCGPDANRDAGGNCVYAK